MNLKKSDKDDCLWIFCLWHGWKLDALCQYKDQEWQEKKIGEEDIVLLSLSDHVQNAIKNTIVEIKIVHYIEPYISLRNEKIFK